MALTSAEKVRAYRQRLRDGGGKTFAIDIAGEKLRWVTAIAQSGDSGETEGDLLRVILTNALDRQIEIYHKATQLLEAGSTHDQIRQFCIDNRDKPVTDIANYLPTQHEKQGN